MERGGKRRRRIWGKKVLHDPRAGLAQKGERKKNNRSQGGETQSFDSQGLLKVGGKG